MNKIPIMPKEYIGEIKKSCGYTKNNPRKWTKEEIEWVNKLKEAGYSIKEIAYSINRSETSVSVKVKRQSKKNNTYNIKHLDEKYAINELFLKEIKPKTVLDLFCGGKNYYKEYNTTTNDKDKKIKATYNEDALKTICKLYSENKKYDLIDLDPYGSAYECFDLAIKMAKKGLIITLGELGHKRWKRLDFVSSHYDINKMEDFTLNNIIKQIQKIGLQNKKELEVFKAIEWKNIGRVYFTIKSKKITKQWEVKENNKQINIFDILQNEESMI